MRWRLVQDYDGNWYIIPNLMMRNWYEWMDVDGEEGSLDVPEWAELLEAGPESISFKEWVGDW